MTAPTGSSTRVSSKLIAVLYRSARGDGTQLRVELREGMHGRYVALVPLSTTPAGNLILGARPISVRLDEASGLADALRGADQHEDHHGRQADRR